MPKPLRDSTPKTRKTLSKHVFPDNLPSQIVWKEFQTFRIYNMKIESPNQLQILWIENFAMYRYIWKNSAHWGSGGGTGAKAFLEYVEKSYRKCHLSILCNMGLRLEEGTSCSLACCWAITIFNSIDSRYPNSAGDLPEYIQKAWQELSYSLSTPIIVY